MMDAVGAGGAAVCVGVGGGCCCCCGGGGASVLDGAPFDAGADVGAPSPAPSFLAASLIAPSLLRCHRFANRPIRFFLRFQNKKKRNTLAPRQTITRSFTKRIRVLHFTIALSCHHSLVSWTRNWNRVFFLGCVKATKGRNMARNFLYDRKVDSDIPFSP